MRLLFVSDTTAGGSGRSQRELASVLVRRGHEVTFLVNNERPARRTRWLYGHLSDLAARMNGRSGQRIAEWLERQPGRKVETCDLAGLVHRVTPIPQNALARVLNDLQPDVVVCNSVERLTWRRIQPICAAAGIPTVLYVREIDSLDHMVHGQLPDVLVTNAEGLRTSLIDRGYECEFVPSVIDVDVTRAATTRRVALLINPAKVEDSFWELASRVPEIPIVVQEAWTLDEESLTAIEHRIAGLGNVEFRRAVAPGPTLYADARVLLVPYPMNSRPRVIAEAQANGIPVIAADLPALAEAVGSGGVTLPLGDVDRWVATMRELWNDQERYEAVSDEALLHSQRPEIDPDHVSSSFEAILARLDSARS